LYRDGQPVTVTPKALATLTVLVSRHGTAVSKEELLATVWPDTAVEEASLSQNIYTLRKLLAKDFPGQTPIENIPKFGYRFHGEVIEETIALPDGGLEGEGPPEAAIPPSGQPQSGRRWERRLPWAVPVAAAAGLAASIYFLWSAGFSFFPPKTLQYEATRFTSNSDEDRITAVGLSPDGKLVAYADADGIVLRGVQDATTHFLPSPPMRAVQTLSWFPDQLHLVLSGDDASTGEPQVWKISVLGEPPVLLRKDARLAAVSHDGSSVAFTSADSSQVWVMGSSGEGAREVMQAGLGERFSVLLWARRDDGLLLERRTSAAHTDPADRIALKPTRDDRMTYERVDLRSGRPTTVQTNFGMGDACLDSTGALIYSFVTPEAGQASMSLWKVGLDAASGAMHSSPVKLMEVSDGSRFYGFSCDATGRTISVLREQGATRVFVGALQAGGTGLSAVRPLSQDSEVAYPHGWTSDSRAVLYEARRNGHWQVYTHALDRHDPEPISSMSGWQSRPVLTPDHRWVLFLDQALPNAQRTLYRIPSQGGVPEAVPSQEDLQNFRCPVFSGSCVVRTKAANGQGVYSTLDPLTGRGAALFREPSGWAFGQDWDLSQDGSTLVVYADTASGLPLHTVSLKTGRVKDIAYRPTSRMVGVNWASGGDGFLVSCTEPSEPSENSLFYVNLAGKSVLLRTTSVETWAVPSPDGRWIAFIDRSLDSNVWLLQSK